MDGTDRRLVLLFESPINQSKALKNDIIKGIAN